MLRGGTAKSKARPSFREKGRSESIQSALRIIEEGASVNNPKRAFRMWEKWSQKLQRIPVKR